MPVTVKHRIGLDHDEAYSFVRDFVGTVAAAGCDVFIVHARNAVLKGLSPKENREVPPLRYDVVRQLKRDFPTLTIVLNGGLADWDAIERELAHVDGVMLGRVAYHDPVFSRAGGGAALRRRIAGALARRSAAGAGALRAVAARAWRAACVRSRGTCSGSITAASGGRRFRQILSDAAKLKDAGPELFLEALAAVEPTACDSA